MVSTTTVEAEAASVSTGRRTRRKHNSYPLWFHIPGGVLFIVLFAVPMFASFYFSLTRWTLFDTEFIGLENYKLFFTEPGAGRVSRIKTDGKLESYSSGLAAGAQPTAIAEGGDGAIWFTDADEPGRIGRLWPASGEIQELTGGLAAGLSVGHAPGGIAEGPDGNVWFTQRGLLPRIVRVTVPPLAEISTPKPAGGRVRLGAGVRPINPPVRQVEFPRGMERCQYLARLVLQRRNHAVVDFQSLAGDLHPTGRSRPRVEHFAFDLQALPAADGREIDLNLGRLRRRRGSTV